jgi:hypothetical protein
VIDIAMSNSNSPTSHNATQIDSTPKDSKKTGSRNGCFLKGIIGLAILAVALYGLQTFMAPKVDVEDDKVLTIREADPSDPIDDKESDTSASDQMETKSGDTETAATGPMNITDSISMEEVNNAEHPLDPLMELADESLKIIDEKYFDYSSKMLTQVQTGGTLNPERLMLVKVRHARKPASETSENSGTENGDAGDAAAKEPVVNEIPFSIYTRFLKPKGMVGQEAIWVSGKNDDMILGHATGLMNIKVIPLSPTSSFAMRGNRYPIYQIGFRNLIVKMKEFGENDRKYGECEVNIDRGLEVDGRKCTRLMITHPVKREHFDYHIAKIYIDNEYQIPTGYEGYLWPEQPGEEPPLLERYFYTDLNLNCGLKDIDFDIKNPEYDFPAW